MSVVVDAVMHSIPVSMQKQLEFIADGVLDGLSGFELPRIAFQLFEGHQRVGSIIEPRLITQVVAVLIPTVAKIIKAHHDVMGCT